MINFNSARGQFIVCIVLSLIYSCTLFAQSNGKKINPVTIPRDGMTRGEVLDTITEQTGYHFGNVSSVLDRGAIVNVKGVYKQLDVLLGRLFIPIGIEWKMGETNIGLMKKTVQDTVRVTLPLRTIKGRVGNKAGDPLIGASIRVLDSKRGTVTDVYGYFTVYNIGENAKLRVSSLGYITSELLVGRDNFLNIILKDSAGNIHPVEIPSQKKKKEKPPQQKKHSFDTHEIALGAQYNMMNSLSGKVPGFILDRGSGRPGTRVKAKVRGQTSINKGTEPLYLIDEVTVSPDYPLGEGTMSDFGSSMYNFSSEDIDSISILKDAISTALYGARGANGVVLITTKRAQYTGRMQCQLKVTGGIGGVPRMEKLMDSRAYLRMRREAFVNDGVQPTRGRAPDLLVWDTTRYTDWQDKLIGNTAYYKEFLATIYGGTSRIKYLFSGNARRASSVYLPDKYRDLKFSVHGNTNISLLKGKWHNSLSVIGNYNNTRLPGDDYTASGTLPPNAPALFKEDGTLNHENNTWVNPLSKTPDFNGTVYNLLVSGKSSYRISPALEGALMAGYHLIGGLSSSINAIAMRVPGPPGTVTASSTAYLHHARTLVIKPTLSYTLSANAHKANLSLGATYNSMMVTNKTIHATGFRRDADILDYDSATFVDRKPPVWNNYKYAGLNTHATYSWKDRYLLEGIVSVDGSSRFGRDKQVAWFGGAAVAWIFSKESLIEDNCPWLSSGKLTIGWASTGNDQIDDYQSQGSYEPTGNYQSVTGLVSATPQNRAYAGEITKKSDITLDLQFFDDRMQFTGAYYRNRSFNQVVAYPLPDMAGGGVLLGNTSVALENSGFELTFGGQPLQTKDWYLSMSMNITIGQNLLAAYPGIAGKQEQGKRPLNEVSFYRLNRVDPITGDYMYTDKLGNAVTAAAITDRTVPINTAPTLFGGFDITGAYRNLELNMGWQFIDRQGADATIDRQYMVGTQRNQNVRVEKRWRKAGDNALFQRATQSAAARSDYQRYWDSDAMFVRAWYARCNNLTLAWKFKQFKIYSNVNNLFTITKYKGADPETGNRSSLPSLRIWKIGVQYNIK